MSQWTEAAGRPSGGVGRTLRRLVPGLAAALLLSLFPGSRALAELPDPAPNDLPLPACTPSGSFICTHPRDVFVRLDDRPEDDSDPLSTKIYRFDQHQGTPVNLLEADFIWNPLFPTEGLSVDKFERIVTVRRKDPVAVDLRSLGLAPGKYMYYDLNPATQGWKGPFDVPLGGMVTPVGDGVDKIYVPQVINVLPCAAASPTHINQIHWCHNNMRCPSWYKSPNEGNWSPEDDWIVAHPAYRALGPSSFPSGPNTGFKNLGGGLGYYQGAKMVTGFARWFLTDEYVSSTGGAGYYAGTFSSPDQCQTPWVYDQYFNQGVTNPKWNNLIRAGRVESVEEKKAMMAFAEGSDRPAAGMGTGPDTTVTLGNDITTRVFAKTYWRLFGSCGDNCVSGNNSIPGETTELELPSRILFGSEGASVTEQAAYTIVPNPGAVVVQRMTLSGGIWNYTPVLPVRVEDTGFDDNPDDGPPNYIATFGNATAPDSRAPCYGDDFIYMRNAHPRHFTVASRFWRSGGTTFHYLDDGSGNVAWEEHAFDLSTIGCASPCDTACTGAFSPPAVPLGGNITIGTGVFAITADGAGNLYWLTRGFLPDNVGGETYPDIADMLPDPNAVTPSGPFSGWPTKDVRADFSAPTQGHTVLPPPANAHYINQEDFTPPADNMAYPKYVRNVYLRQNESYELYGFNYQPYRNQSSIDASLGGPYDAQIDRRGALSNGGQIFAYEATAPQVAIPAPDDNLISTTIQPSVWVASTDVLATCAADASAAATAAALTTPTGLTCGAWVETLNPLDARPPNFLDINTEAYSVTRVRDCVGAVLNVRTATTTSPASGPGTPTYPAYDDGSLDFTSCTTPTTLPHYVAYSTGTLRETQIEQHEYLFKTGAPGTFTWSPLGSGNPVEAGAVSFQDFTLDMAAVNVTEPPPFAGADTQVDIYVDGGATPTEDTPLTIRLENGPYFGGQFTNAAYGAQNSNYLGAFDSGFPSEPSPKSEGDADGDGLTSAFGSSTVQALFAYRYRIQAVTEPQRYAYNRGAPASPDPSNDGVVWRYPQDGSFHLPSGLEFDTRIEALLQGPAGPTFTFDDPGKYRVVIDIQGQYWVPPAGGLNFFSQPDDLTFTRFRGAYPAGTPMDLSGATDPGDLALAFEGQPAGHPDRDPWDSGEYMRIYQDLTVGPKLPINDTTYVKDIQVTALTGSFAEDVGGDEETGAFAPAAPDDMPDNVPDKTARIQAADASSVPGSADDIRRLVATFEVDWYRAEDFDYDADLGAGPINLFGDVFQGGAPGEPTQDMFKYGGVGVLAHPSSPPACGGLNVALASLANQGMLASMGTTYDACQTHVAKPPTRTDWAAIRYSWYVKAKDPTNSTAWLPAPAAPGATDLGYLIARGDLGELWDMDQTAGGLLFGSPGDDHHHQVFRNYITGATSDLLVPGTGYPGNRDYQVTLPLYGRDPTDQNRLLPLEVAVPTLPVDDALVFTVVIDYPKVEWVPGAPGEPTYVLRQVPGAPHYGAYTSCGDYVAGTCPNGANPAAEAAYAAIDIEDRTPPWLDGFDGLAPSSHTGGVVQAMGAQTEGDLTADILLRLKDNAVYEDQVPGKPVEFRYEAGFDPRVAWATDLWETPGNFGIGAEASGSPPPPFDISFMPMGVGGSFLRQGTRSDFPGAEPHNADNIVYKTNDGNYGTTTAGMGSANPVVITIPDPDTYFTPKTPEATDRSVSTSPPADWILYRSTNTWDGPVHTVTGRMENFVKGVWGIQEEQLPVPAFVTDAATGEVNVTMVTSDTVDNGGLPESVTGHDLVDFAAPNLMVEFLDQRSGQAVYFTAVSDWRHRYDGSLKSYDAGTELEKFRIQVSKDDRPVMVSQSQARSDKQEFGPFAQVGNGSGQLIDFRTDMGSWTRYTALDDLGGPGQTSYNWLVEEDVLFRVRAIAVDNATPPSLILLGIRSLGASSHPYPGVPAGWTGGDPPAASTARVIGGKAVIEGWHRYPREGTTDALEIVAKDQEGNTRIIQVGLESFPNDTDFRVISDRVRKTN